jgi:hypothetical protein
VLEFESSESILKTLRNVAAPAKRVPPTRGPTRYVVDCCHWHHHLIIAVTVVCVLCAFCVLESELGCVHLVVFLCWHWYRKPT